jgi:hypothetical protein
MQLCRMLFEMTSNNGYSQFHTDSRLCLENEVFDYVVFAFTHNDTTKWLYVTPSNVYGLIKADYCF